LNGAALRFGPSKDVKEVKVNYPTLAPAALSVGFR